MASLLFTFQQFIDEIDKITSLTENFLENKGVLDQYKTNLINIRSAVPNSEKSWKIGEGNPLRTKPYSCRDLGRDYEAYAEITCIWGIKPLGSNSSKKKNIMTRKFTLSGKASTKIKIIDSRDSSQLALWRFEIGTDESPGCYFHVHIKEGHPSIPRLPGILITIGDALDFVLGELFQDEWLRHVGEESSPLRAWRRIQKERFSKILSWKCNEIENKSGTPWLALKRAKPASDLFICR